ncbi:MAG: YlcI/YnfO family protein [Cyanobacteria bacterium J06621_3]
MSRLTLRLPETLHQQLTRLAESEGVSLNQYIVYALTRQTTPAYSVHPVPTGEVTRQEEDFRTLINKLEPNSPEHLMTALSQREKVEPEEELSPEIISRIKQRIQNAAQS